MSTAIITSTFFLFLLARGWTFSGVAFVDMESIKRSKLIVKQYDRVSPSFEVLIALAATPAWERVIVEDLVVTNGEMFVVYAQVVLRHVALFYFRDG